MNMKPSNTQQRLRHIMEERNYRQIDILNLTAPLCKKYNIKFSRSDISQYLSGKTEPNQDKLYILSIALNVNVVWLMGYDVPEYAKATNVAISLDEKELLTTYNQLNDFGKVEARKRVDELTEIPRYTKVDDNQPYLVAAHIKDGVDPESEDAIAEKERLIRMTLENKK